MNELDQEIAAYDAIRADLESRYIGKWVVIHGAALVDVFPTFEQAADAAVREFGRGPYLIRQVGAAPIGMSASFVFNLQHFPPFGGHQVTRNS